METKVQKIVAKINENFTRRDTIEEGLNAVLTQVKDAGVATEFKLTDQSKLIWDIFVNPFKFTISSQEIEVKETIQEQDNDGNFGEVVHKTVTEAIEDLILEKL